MMQDIGRMCCSRIKKIDAIDTEKSGRSLPEAFDLYAT
jgi:hypothetical protein